MKNRMNLRKEILKEAFNELKFNNLTVGSKCVLLKPIDDWCDDIKYPNLPKGTVVEVIEKPYNRDDILFGCAYDGTYMEWSVPMYFGTSRYKYKPVDD